MLTRQAILTAAVAAVVALAVGVFDVGASGGTPSASRWVSATTAPPVTEPPVTTTTTPPATTTTSAPTAAVVLQVAYTDPSRGDRVVPITVFVPSHQPGATLRLVVFAHGFDTSAATYATLEQQLTTAGFVVAAPDFPFTSSDAGNGLNRGDVVNQAADISFVITELFDPTTTPPELRNVLRSTDPVGVVGHSDGGITAAAAAYSATAADARVGAAVVLSGSEAFYPGSWFSTQSPPLLAIHGDTDEVNPYASSLQLYDDATGPKWLVTVLGGSHLGPFTTDPVEPAVSTLVADFLHVELEHASDIGRIDADTNQGGLALAAESRP